MMEAKSRFPSVDKNAIAKPSGRTEVKTRVLAKRFDGFEDELVLARNKRKDDIEKKFRDLQSQITDTKTSLALEAKNRAISVNAVQQWLTDRIEQWTVEVQTPIFEQIQAVNDRLDVCMDRLSTLEAEHKADRENFPLMIEERCNELLVEIRDVRTILEQNIKQREEAEHRIRVKIQQNADLVEEQFQVEKRFTEDRRRQIKTDLESEVEVRIKGMDFIKRKYEEEIARIDARIGREEQERSKEHEECMQALNHYAAALQDGVKIVGL